MRVLRTLIAVAFSIIVFATVAVVLGLYLAATGRSVPLLETLADRAGDLVRGQQTESLDLALRLQPDLGELSATARLTMRSDVDGRRNLYFLLNQGMQVRSAWHEGADGVRRNLPVYRLWLLTILTLPQPLHAGEKARIGIEYGGRPASAWPSMGASYIEPEESVLSPMDLWYPADLQGFFLADVEVTAPASLRILHNGDEIRAEQQGLTRRVRWRTRRPAAGLALVAGTYEQNEIERGGSKYRLFLPADTDLDPERILDSIASSDQRLTSLFGSTGLGGLSLFVSRRLARGFYDGSGLIGLDTGSFRGGDYGLGAIAHEVAHSWWGGTVGPKWLEPETGGQWIVEGFAEFSSWLVIGRELDDRSWLRRLFERQYDPSRAESLASLSVFDNAFDPSAAQTIYYKGAYVTYMLQQLVGEEAFASSARALLERFRYGQVGEADVQKVFAEVSGKDLQEFFDKWVRSDATLDLSLNPQDGGTAAHNLGSAPPPAPPALWRFVPAEEPARQTIDIGATTPLGNVERLLLDPQGQTADMFRSNNVFPRRENPRAVLRSARGDFAVVYGEPFPWVPASVVHIDAQGQEKHTWPFDRGLSPEPRWSPDGTRILAVERKADLGFALVALNATDGSRETIGDDTDATAVPDGIVHARDATLVHVTGNEETVLVRHPTGSVKNPDASPDGTHIAYALRSGQELDLRIVATDSGQERLLLTVRPSPIRWDWSADGSRLFAVIAGDWDWQVWELPVGAADAPRPLVREAASVIDVAPAPDGNRIAVIAASELRYGKERREVFIVDLSTGEAREYNLGGRNGHSVAWLDANQLLVVVSDPTFPVIPPHRELMRLSLEDGSLAAFP